MPRIVDGNIDHWFNNNISLPTKTLWIGSSSYSSDDGSGIGVNYSMSESVIKGLHVLESLNNSEPITIIMNNPGGCWYNGMAIYDYIKRCVCTVNIEVYGEASSMGTVILQAADKRSISPNSSFFIHYGEDGYEGHSKNFERWAEQSKHVNKQMEDIYLNKIRNKKPKYTRAKLQELLKYDTFMTAKETVDLGLADEIIE